MPQASNSSGARASLGRAGIKRGGKRLIGLLATEHRISFLLPSVAVDPRRPSRHLVHPLSNEPKNPSMRRTVPLVCRWRLAGLLLAACDNIDDMRGFAPSPGAVDKLEVGTQSREDVQRLIGSPSAVATFNPNVWYYISAEAGILGPFQAVDHRAERHPDHLRRIGPRADHQDTTTWPTRRTSPWWRASRRPRARS